MPKIFAKNGEYADVDMDDYEKLCNYTWSDNGNGYLSRRIWKSRDKYQKIYLHREIMSAVPGQYVDHKDGNKRNNKKDNLRICSNAQNSANQNGRKGSSIYKGVYFDKHRKLWVAQITVNYKCIKLGAYENESEAALAYNNCAVFAFKEFSLLNKIKLEAK